MQEHKPRKLAILELAAEEIKKAGKIVKEAGEITSKDCKEHLEMTLAGADDRLKDYVRKGWFFTAERGRDKHIKGHILDFYILTDGGRAKMLELRRGGVRGF